MQHPGSILLISCYELGHQPLAIASAVGFLERAGYSVDVLDASLDGFDSNKVSRATFIGISVPMHTALRLGVRAAELIREINPASHICFYGLYASLNAEFLLEDLADSVIGGEFESPLVALVEAIGVEDKLQFDRTLKVVGVRFRNRVGRPFLERLSFAAPSFSGLPSLSRYAKLESHGSQRLAGYVEASRGCLHNCLHCPIPPVYNGRFFVVPEAIVLEAIRDLVSAGATHITFGDPDFLNGPGHSLRVIRTMHKEFPGLTFDFTAKVEHLLKQRSLLQEFAGSGCIFVVSAFESLSDAVLANLAKGHTRADIDSVLELFRDLDIALRPTWVPFTPWTTLDDYVDWLEYIGSAQLVSHIDPVQYAIRLLVPPGSALLKHSGIKPFLGPLDQGSFSYRWIHPDSRMDELQEEVSEAVQRMTQANVATLAILRRVRELAYAARGEKAIPFVPELAQHYEAPRLTESWFC
jgi:radical SAM superfamily enzyme YgiQ (UPF0313 family)